MELLPLPQPTFLPTIWAFAAKKAALAAELWAWGSMFSHAHVESPVSDVLRQSDAKCIVSETRRKGMNWASL